MICQTLLHAIADFALEVAGFRLSHGGCWLRRCLCWLVALATATFGFRLGSFCTFSGSLPSSEPSQAMMTLCPARCPRLKALAQSRCFQKPLALELTAGDTPRLASGLRLHSDGNVLCARRLPFTHRGKYHKKAAFPSSGGITGALVAERQRPITLAGTTT